MLLRLYSSHLIQPLNVDIFSPLKLRMSQELNEIMHFGVSNIKKFEWVNCYRIAKPNAMKESNILSAWNSAGLLSFNPQKVIRHLKSERAEAETEFMIAEHLVPKASASMSTPSPLSNRFAHVLGTPSKLNSDALHIANEALIGNIQKRILNTPTKAYISKLVALSK